MDRETPLRGLHEKIGARMVAFAGWKMPISYSGILDEYRAVRQDVGIFDISHMGNFFISGKGCEVWLNGLLSNDLSLLGEGMGQYTFLLNEQGGVIDDLIAYKMGEDSFFLVVNASKIAEDFAWFLQYKPEGLFLSNASEEWVGMAVQGPAAPEIFTRLFNQGNLPKRNTIARYTWGNSEVIVCVTGYTGELGFEVFVPAGDGESLFAAFLEKGALPCGLGARDILRLEMCYPLNGSDLSPKRTPLEAGLAFFCSLDKKQGFIGCQSLVEQKKQGVPHKLVALQMAEKSPPPRPHYNLLSSEGESLGELASGGFSPSLNAGIAMAYVPASFAKKGTQLYVEMRGKRFLAHVVAKPFYKKSQ